jgi:uncharacterized OB-fold protein
VTTDKTKPGSAGYGKPLPIPSPLAEPFWSALRKKELHLQKCMNCGHFNHPPKLACSACHSRDVAWTKVAGTGRIYSYTIVHRPPVPAFKGDVPYAVGLVDMDGTDTRLLSSLLLPFDDIHIDAQVQVMFDDVTEDMTLFRFGKVVDEGAGK